MRFQRAEHIASRQLLDETVVVPIAGQSRLAGKIYALNDVAGFVWQQLIEPMALDELSQAVRDEFDVTAEQADVDIRDFVAELTRVGLVKEVD